MKLMHRLAMESIKEDYADSEPDTRSIVDEALSALESYITTSSSSITGDNTGLSSDALELINTEYNRIKERYARDHYLPTVTVEADKNNYTLTIEMLSALNDLKDVLQGRKK